MTSPFSPLQNYEIMDKTIANRHYSFTVTNLNPYERKVVNFVRNNKAAAMFQLSDTRKETNKIRKLVGAGILCMYNLVGGVRMNVVSWAPMDINEMLRSCAITHYVLLSGNPLTGKSVFIDDVEHFLFVPRGNEPMDILTANVYPHILVISDQPRPEFKDLTSKARIYLDDDLCDNELKEYSPKDFK